MKEFYDMRKIKISTISQNVLHLIETSGISDVDFAAILDKSDRTIKRIRQGSAFFSIDDINIISTFFGVPIEDLNIRSLKIRNNLRQHLLEKHRHDTLYFAILSKRPSITFAIKQHLLNHNDFVIHGLSVKQIIDFFKTLNWEYSSSYISNAMKRNSHSIIISSVKIINGKSVNIYKPIPKN